MSGWKRPVRFQAYRRRLEGAAARYFAERGLPVRARAPWILADAERWADNLIDPAWAGLVAAEQARHAAAGEGFPLHRHAHHGLSSQAMLFNLVLPLLAADDLDALAPAFAGAPWPGPGARARLECSDRATFAEDRGQPTSFDLCIEGPGGPPLFVEAKLAEPGFGGCSLLAGGDCAGANPAADPRRCPLHRLGRRYWERLDALGFLDGPIAEGPACALGPWYQFFREAAFALLHGGHYVLLVHDHNPAFQRTGPGGGAEGLWPWLRSLVPPAHRPRLHRVTLQQVAEVLAATGRHDAWLPAFRARYALDPPGPEPEEADVNAVLAALPAGVAAEIRELWTRRVAGADRPAARAALRRVSRLLQDAGIAHGSPEWRAVVAHGRRIYEGATRS